MSDVLVLFAGVYSCFYLLVVVLLSIGIYRLRRQKPPGYLPPVSVIVCARNEELVIRRCLESLVRLDYPREKLEIILVDDESEDNTGAIMEEYASRHSILTVLSTEGVPRDLPAKQRPLNLGINHASGEIILVTDADCAVKPGWINGHIAAYNGVVGITGGVTVISKECRGLFSRLQGSELVAKLAVAMGLAGLGLPITVMGNNMSLRRDAYDSCGGLTAVEPNIVEDMALMNAVIGRTGYRLGWAGTGESVVETMPEGTFYKLINQRLRWITEIGNFSRFGKMFIVIEIIMALSFFMSVLLVRWTPVIPFITGLSWLFGYILLLTAVPGTILSDFVLIPGMLVFQFMYGIVLLWKGITGNLNVEWKGRVYSDKRK